MKNPRTGASSSETLSITLTGDPPSKCQLPTCTPCSVACAARPMATSMPPRRLGLSTSAASPSAGPKGKGGRQVWWEGAGQAPLLSSDSSSAKATPATHEECMHRELVWRGHRQNACSRQHMQADAITWVQNIRSTEKGQHTTISSDRTRAH